jgi:nucleolar protein 15
MVASPKLSSRKVPEKKHSKSAANTVSKKKLAVVNFSRLPHEFTEKDIRAFFGQFGGISKLRLSRSKKTGNSRGYGYIQYMLPEVATIAVEATNNYFIAGKPIKTALMNPEAVHKGLFIGAPPGNHALSRSAAVRKRHNGKIHGLVNAKTLERDAARAEKLAAMGIEYTIERRVVEKKVKA